LPKKFSRLNVNTTDSPSTSPGGEAECQGARIGIEEVLRTQVELLGVEGALVRTRHAGARGTAPPGQAGDTLLRFGRDIPCVVVRGVGVGRILVCGIDFRAGIFRGIRVPVGVGGGRGVLHRVDRKRRVQVLPGVAVRPVYSRLRIGVFPGIRPRLDVGRRRQVCGIPPRHRVRHRG
jgi:hypothetical protein